MPETPVFYFNGVNGDTGTHWLPPCDLESLREHAAFFRADPGTRRLSWDHDPRDLSQVHWGILWPADVDTDRRDALQPLIDRRTRQVGQAVAQFEIHPGQTYHQFRQLHGMAFQAPEFHLVPYHLLIVASPEEIPFEFQSALGVAHSVGRLHFDELDDLHSYVAALCDYEATASPPECTATLAGISHPGDRLTQSSVEYFVKDLDYALPRRFPEWRLQTLLRQAPTKECLLRLLQERPSLFVSVSHGIGFSPDSERHHSHQGALLTGEFPGMAAWGGRPLPNDMLLSATDIDPNTNLSGMVSFQFACYSAGTDHHELYAWADPKIKAHASFVSGLPQKLLARGALGVIGHVGVTLEMSYLEHASVGPQSSTFRETLSEIMSGLPVGHALDHMQSRQRELASELALQATRAMQRDDPAAVLGRLGAWFAFQDARHFVLLGDPAARLNPTST